MSSKVPYHLWQDSCCLFFQEGIKGSYYPKWKWWTHDYFPFHPFFPSVEIYIRWSCNPFLSGQKGIRKSPLLWSPWQQPLTLSQGCICRMDWIGLWSGECDVGKHTGWFKLEIISGFEFHVCFGSLYWLKSPKQLSLLLYVVWNGSRSLLTF